MSIIGKTAVTRYEVTGLDKDRVRYLKDVRQHLGLVAFKDIDNDPATESFAGFVRYDDWLATDFGTGAVVVEPFVAWKLRIDTRKVPDAIFKAEVAKQVRARREAIKKEGLTNPTSATPAEELKTIKEAVRDKLLKQTIPTPVTADVVWSTTTGHVYLSSTSGALKDALVMLFTKAFPDLHLQEVTPTQRARGTEMDLPETLGLEFTTWLWNLTEDTERRFHGHKNNILSVTFGKEVVAAGKNDNDESETITAKGDRWKGMDGLKAELDCGKRITKADMEMSEGSDDWAFTLHSFDWKLAGLKTPAVTLDEDDASDNEMVLREKVYLVERVYAHLDVIFHQFIRERYTLRDAVGDKSADIAAKAEADKTAAEASVPAPKQEAPKKATPKAPDKKPAAPKKKAQPAKAGT